MSLVGDLVERKERPAFVRFEKRPMEDRAASEREGRYVAKDVDFALVTAPYSRDVFEQEAKEWLAQMRRESENGRLPTSWYERYVEMYERWKKNEDMPVEGTPIKSWPVISPAQVKNLTSLNILTVEDLAAANDEGLRRIGMGAVDLRNKARAWLKQAQDKGPLTIENANLKAENSALKANVEGLQATVQELTRRVEILARGGVDRTPPSQRRDGIQAGDILDDEPAPQPTRRRKAQQQPQPQEESESAI
jgi:hypothetical protein